MTKFYFVKPSQKHPGYWNVFAICNDGKGNEYQEHTAIHRTLEEAEMAASQFNEMYFTHIKGQLHMFNTSLKVLQSSDLRDQTKELRDKYLFSLVWLEKKMENA